MITLRSNRLRVEIAEPTEPPNRTFRFDRAGFITEVVLDGAVHFCASEPQNLSHPSSGGRGICNEFTADYSRNVTPGTYFPKLGVGLIRRDAEPYIFYKRYDDTQPYPVEYSSSEDQAVFRTRALPCGQAAISFVKTVRVCGSTLAIVVSATNQGETEVDTLEYCHNFFSVDGMAIGPEYEVELPQIPDQGTEQKIDIHGNLCNWRGNGKGLTFLRFAADCAHIRVPVENVPGEVFHWTLRHRGAKAWVSVTEHFKPAKMEIWAVDHIISPEVFYHLVLQPGETRSWKREWEFGKAY